MPRWLESLAVISLIAGGASALLIAAHLLRKRQHMWIMNAVWPVTALYAGPVALWFYFRYGRLSSRENVRRAMERGEENPGKRKPFWALTAVGATHCGSGCTLGDIAAEWFIFAVPLTLFGRRIFAAWALDYVLAFTFGIAFQYFTIRPMRKLSRADGLVAALKADTLSLTAWQVGMYGWMAIATFGIFGHELEKTDPVFWFMMQIAMLTGFATSFPVNWWLLKQGIKEPM